jgi:hypothetical protein
MRFASDSDTLYFALKAGENSNQILLDTLKPNSDAYDIDCWSATARQHGKLADGPTPLRAGLVLHPEMDRLEALLRLRHAARQVGVVVSAPTLCRAAGDDVGWMRDRKLERLWAA